jgi:hypothetical protein
LGGALPRRGFLGKARLCGVLADLGGKRWSRRF